MKRRRGSPKVSFFHECPEFFEVFIPDRNSHQLCIPEDFTKHFEGTIPKKTILKDLSGKVWYVELEQEGKGLFLTKGWEQFAKDNSLQLGDFIVFRYNRSSDFNVRVFGCNGCKKEDASYNENKIVPFVKEEEESEPEPVYKENYSQKYPPKSKKLKGSNEVSPLKPRIASKVVNKCQHVEKERAVPPKDLCFTTSIRGYSPQKLHIPKRVLVKYQIKLQQEVVLRNYNGELWPVTVLHTNDQRTLLSKGWPEFCNDNHVGFHDKLEFQYVLGNGRECKEFVVHIKREGR